MNEQNLEEFYDAYVTCALWSSTHEDTPLDSLPNELAPETKEQMRADCKKFMEENWELLQKTGAPVCSGGHDFWLTRNGHGVGFWDRGYGDPGDELTLACEAYGQVDLYIGDDGLIYG